MVHLKVSVVEQTLQFPGHLTQLPPTAAYPSLQEALVAAATVQVLALTSVHGSQTGTVGLAGVVVSLKYKSGQVPSATHYSVVADPRGAFILIGVAGAAIEQVRHVVELAQVAQPGKQLRH